MKFLIGSFVYIVICIAGLNTHGQSTLEQYQFVPTSGTTNVQGLLVFDTSLADNNSVSPSTGSYFYIDDSPVQFYLIGSITLTPYISLYAHDNPHWGFDGGETAFFYFDHASYPSDGPTDQWGANGGSGPTFFSFSGTGYWEPVPVPEPSVLAFACLGVTTMLLLTRRRK
jgi:hypothetical protein